VRRKIGKFHKQNDSKCGTISSESHIILFLHKAFLFMRLGRNFESIVKFNHTAPVLTGTAFLFGSVIEPELSFFIRTMQLHTVLSNSGERERYLMNKADCAKGTLG